MDKLRIDFETYSEAELKKVGAWAYSVHPSTEVLIMAWAFNNEAPRLWLPTSGPPNWFYGLTNSDLNFRICARNDFFEYCIMKNVLKWPAPGPEFWEDSSAQAAALALPRSLAGCCAALAVDSDKQKDSEGSKLIKIFSIPRRFKGKCIRTFPKDKPQEFEQFKNYCIKDVISDRHVSIITGELSGINRTMWELDRKINLRGVRFDMNSVHNAIIIRNTEEAKKIERIKILTNGHLINIKSRGQFMSYLKRIGAPVENAQAEYLKRHVKKLKKMRDTIPPSDEHGPVIERFSEAIEIIETRLSVVKTSLGKYDKLLEIIPEGDRAYGLLRWHGASTGRWSGNLFQPQNLPRPSIDNTEECVSLFRFWNPDALNLLYGDALEALSSCIRSMIIASPGSRLIVSDFSQIESRFIRWLTGDEKGLNKYREGLDIYKVNASSVFKVAYSDVSKDQRLIGKVIELACGYQGGVRAFQRFADVYGVVIPDEQAIAFIKAWRSANPKIIDYWYSLQDAATAAIQKPGSIQAVRNIKFKVIGSGNRCFLFCQLPSKRLLSYHKPHLSDGPYGKPQIRYWGIDSVTKTYKRQSTYGGKLAENITQAVACDRLGFSMLEVEKAGYPIILTVHDEIIADVKKNHGSIEEFNSIMKINPQWAKGLPIEAAGYEAERYRKE